jgi:hypothetical protein
MTKAALPNTFSSKWGRVRVGTDGVYATITDEPGRITPTQTLPIEGEGFCGRANEDKTLA